MSVCRELPLHLHFVDFRVSLPKRLFQQILEKKKHLFVQRRINIASFLISTCILVTVYHCCGAPWFKVYLLQAPIGFSSIYVKKRAPLLMHASIFSNFYTGLYLNNKDASQSCSTEWYHQATNIQCLFPSDWRVIANQYRVVRSDRLYSRMKYLAVPGYNGA